MRTKSANRKYQIRKYQSTIFLRSNKPATSLTVIDFRPSHLAMLNFSGNAQSGREAGTRAKSGEDCMDEMRSAGWTFYGFPLSHSETKERDAVGVGKCSSDIVFLFRSTKAPWSNFANATKSGRAPYLLSVVVILLGTFAHAEKHSLNCHRECRRRWRTRTQEDVFIQFRRVTSDNVLMQRWFIRYSNAFSMRSSHRSRPGDANELIIQYKRSAFDSVST